MRVAKEESPKGERSCLIVEWWDLAFVELEVVT
jgi:hypothetical protein